MNKVQKVIINAVIWGFLVMIFGIFIIAISPEHEVGVKVGKVITYLGAVSLCLGAIFTQIFPLK